MKHIGAIILLLFVGPFWSHAQDNTIIADYQEMIRDKRAETLELKGNVNIIFQQQHLLCDHAIIYEKTKTIVATGNVVLQNLKTTIRGDKVEFSYDSNKGKIYNGVITSGQVLIEADVIEKIGEDEYKADDAYYTACTTCPASWGFTSASVEAEIGGYAYISRPWLHLLQFPVLPLPYLVVPLNSKRQTGLLVPKPFANNEGGFAVEQPFFWAIDRSHDATFSLINYEKRGLQGTANYRYVISPTSSGTLNTAYLKDRTVAQDAFKDRWFVEYAHHYDLPDDYVQRTQLALASDRKYSFDFFQQLPYTGYPALENSVSLSKIYENSLLTIESSYYLSQIEEPIGFQEDSSLHRLPEINYELVDTKISDDYNVFFNFRAQYLNIMKRGLAFEHSSTDDTVCGNDNICYPTPLSSGEFVYGSPFGTDPSAPNAYGDLIRSGQRLDMMPMIHAPFWVGNIFDVDPSFAMRYTQYSFGVPSDEAQGYSSTPSRFYTQLGLNVKSHLNQVYQWSKETRIKHSVIPEVNLRYIPNVHQSNHNFFGNADSLRYFREKQPIDHNDLLWREGGRGIQFDHNDRIVGKQFVDLGITNKIIRRDTSGGDEINSGYTRALLFNVSQALDIYELRRGSDARAWQALTTYLQTQFGPFSQTLSTETFPYHNRTNWSTSTRYNFFLQNYFQVGFSKQYTINIDPPVDENSRQEFVFVATGIHFPYVDFFGGMTYDLNTSRSNSYIDPFQTWKVALQITPPGSCWTINAELLKNINNIFQPSVSMEFKFSD